jgi:hypothetical protein
VVKIYLWKTSEYLPVPIPYEGCLLIEKENILNIFWWEGLKHYFFLLFIIDPMAKLYLKKIIILQCTLWNNLTYIPHIVPWQDNKCIHQTTIDAYLLNRECIFVCVDDASCVLLSFEYHLQKIKIMLCQDKLRRIKRLLSKYRLGNEVLQNDITWS